MSKLLYNTAAEVPANLINADKRIKGIQIGDPENKRVNFTDNTTIFLRDITYLNRIQVKIKKLVQRNFLQKAKLLCGSAYKNRIHQPGQLE